MVQLSISEEYVCSPLLRTDFLIALNQETIDLHFESCGGRLREDRSDIMPWILFDSEKGMNVEKVGGSFRKIDVPFYRIARP